MLTYMSLRFKIQGSKVLTKLCGISTLDLSNQVGSSWRSADLCGSDSGGGVVVGLDIGPFSQEAPVPGGHCGEGVLNVVPEEFQIRLHGKVYCDTAAVHGRTSSERPAKMIFSLLSLLLCG
jgi:hypothetical protein